MTGEHPQSETVMNETGGDKTRVSHPVQIDLTTSTKASKSPTSLSQIQNEKVEMKR
jgi:hypothetical protein